MSSIVITPLSGSTVAAHAVEIVERKGIGHPDTLCDALAEALSLSLCRYYRDHFDLILHHNVDKALLWGGMAAPAFNGGRLLAPMEIFLAGRATADFMGHKIPIEELMIETCRSWLGQHMHALDVTQHVKLHTLVRPGSSELVALYRQQQTTGQALANDTSCGVGYAPLDELELLVLGLEQQLNDPADKLAHPEIGEDIKIMAVRTTEHVTLTVGCAFVDRYIKDWADYHDKKQRLVSRIKLLAAQYCHNTIEVIINAADGDTPDQLYLTVTGTSAEAGDDGEVGRGNRLNGLITPYRPMNMEAAAGKNPVSHVGKLYNITAQRICAALVNDLAEVAEAYCYLVSRIGTPVQQPQIIDLRLSVTDERQLSVLNNRIRGIVQSQLDSMHLLQDEIINQAIKVY